jgi:hypothetical protein
MGVIQSGTRAIRARVSVMSALFLGVIKDRCP